MRCRPYAWIFVLIFALKFNGGLSACTGSANETAPARDSSVCLDVFVQLMIYQSAQASKFSEGCKGAAGDRRACLLAESRFQLSTAVKGINELLLDCDVTKDPLRYFRCMREIMDEVVAAMDEIGRNSTKVIDDSSAKLWEIDKEERDCLDAVVQNTKSETDQIFVEYKKCLSSAASCCCKSSTSSASSTESNSLTGSSCSTSSTSTPKPEKENEPEIHIQPRSTISSVNFIAVTVIVVVLVLIVIIIAYLCRRRKRCSSEDELDLAEE